LDKSLDDSDTWMIEHGYEPRTQEERDQYKKEQMEIYEGWVYTINVLEIERISANEYHVLVSVVPWYGDYEGETAYRKIRLRDSDFFVNGLDADLAYIPLADDVYDYFITDDINAARTAEFVDKPYFDEEYNYSVSGLLRLTRFWP